MSKVHNKKNQLRIFLKKWLALVLLIAILMIALSQGAQNYLSFEMLKAHRTTLLTWTSSHLLLSAISFAAVYTVAVAISMPGATFLTLVGGFLFGPVVGSILVIFSATLGAVILFFAVKSAMSEWFAQKARGSIHKMRKGFQENAFSYLLFLRLVPLFPFWLVNIVPALLGVNILTFILATLIGIIPGSVVYVLVGNGVSQGFAMDQVPNLKMMLEPIILYPLIGLAVLSLVPIIYQKWFKRG